MAFQVLPVGPETGFNTHLPGAQSAVTLGRVGNGHVAAWQSSGQDGSGIGIRARLLDAEGSPVGAEIAVNTTTGGDQMAPRVAGLPDGGFAVFWSGPDGGDTGLFGRVFDADGSPRSAEFRVNQETGGVQADLQVGVAADGRIWTVWSSALQDTSGLGVYARTFAPDGRPGGDEFRVNLTVAGDQYGPRIAILADGQTVIAWSDNSAGGQTHDVVVRIFGSTVSDEIVVPDPSAGRQSDAVIAPLAFGGFVTGWLSTGGQDGNGLGVHARIYRPDGTFGPVLTLPEITAGNQFGLRLLAQGDGGFAAVWVDAGTVGTEAGIYARLFDGDGNPMSGAVRIDAGAPAGTSPELHAVELPSGGVAVAWGGPDGDGRGLFLATVLPGDVTAVPALSVNAIETGLQAFPVLSADDEGGLVAAWTSFATGDADVRGRLFALVNSITGSQAADILGGSDGRDLIEGRGGDDILRGFGGNDTLRGGEGADTLNGGDGDDLLVGGDTTSDLRDVIFGGAGNDSVDAGHGNDLVYGGDGNDTVEGGFGVDTIEGQAGDDVLTGSAFSDLVFGGDGSDFINGGFGSDRVNGGAGADRFFHLGIADHGSDWVQDYRAAEGDVLVWGGGAATRAQFQVNTTETAGAGAAGVDEAFVIYRPTGQILWALVDGDAQSSINLQVGGQVFDLLA